MENDLGRDSDNSNGYTPVAKRAPVKFRFRAILNVAMSVLYLILAAAIATKRKFIGTDISPALAYGLSALLALYGIFRLWRGVQDWKTDPEDVD